MFAIPVCMIPAKIPPLWPALIIACNNLVHLEIWTCVGVYVFNDLRLYLARHARWLIMHRSPYLQEARSSLNIFLSMCGNNMPAKLSFFLRRSHHSTPCEQIYMHDSPPPTLVQSVVTSNISTPSLTRNLLQQICPRSCYLTASAFGHWHMGPTWVWPTCQWCNWTYS